MSENWLVLETSGRVGRVGLARGGTVVRSGELNATRRHARDLTVVMEAMLTAEGLKPQMLTGVMVGRGPGSYTGLRVGLMTAKGLAYATGCQLRVVDTFAAIALQTPQESSLVSVIADALQGQVYAQRFRRQGTGWEAAGPLGILPVADWVAQLITGEWVSGPGVEGYDGQIPAENRRVSEADRRAQVASVFAIGRSLAPLSREQLFTLEPLYLRGSSAEEKAKTASG